MNRIETFLPLLLVLACFQATAQHRPQQFDAIKVRPPDAPENIEFALSAAAATSKAPVVISVPGRKLDDSDRKFRTWLQKYWLSANVPEHMSFVGRALVECEYIRKGEYAFCDEYVFNNPASGQDESFFIYVGNWP